MPEYERPTEEYIAATAAHLKEVWQATHAKWREIDGFVTGQFPVWVQPNGSEDKDRPAYRPARARSIVDQAVDTQLPYEPRMQRVPANDSETQKEAANRVENYLKAAWDEASTLETAMPAKQISRFLVTYGYAVWEGPYLRRRDQPVKDPDEEAEDYERRYADWFPYRMRAIVPTKVLLPPHEKRPTYAIKLVKQYAKDLADLTYDRKKRLKRGDVDVYDYGKKPWAEVQTVEYFSSRWHALMTGSDKKGSGRLLFVERNTDGFVPFTHAYSGWGQEPSNLEAQDPQYLCQGILDPVRDSLRRQAQAASAMHNALVNAAFPKRGTRKDPGEAAQALLGDIVQGEEGDWWWDKFPDLPQHLYNTNELVTMDIEQGTFSLMQAGFRQAGVETVGQQAILMNKSNLKFRGITKQMEDMASVVAGNFLRLADSLESIPVLHGHKLSSDDIGGQYGVNVHFELVDPVLALQERELAMREFQALLIDREGYWEAARKEDSSKIQRGLLEDAVYRMPAVHNEMVLRAMERLGFKELAESLRKQSLVLAQGGTGVDGDQGGNGTVPLPSEEPQSPGNPQVPAKALREMKKPLTEQVMTPSRIPPGARP